MNFSSRITRIALIAWALYLTIALTAFALHAHSPHENGEPACALCIGHNITGAVAAVAALALATPTLCWILQLWLMRAQSAFVAPIQRKSDSRGPPLEVFFLTQN